MAAKSGRSLGQRNWSNVSPSGISSAVWPFRYCSIMKKDSCEEVLGQDMWNNVTSKRNSEECDATWNGKMLRNCRRLVETLTFGTLHAHGRNLFHMLLSKHFEDKFLTQQEISLRPFEIYVAPCGYTRYNPQIDVCIVDPSENESICLNITEACSKTDVEDSMYKTMFSTLSGNSSTAYCFVIKAYKEGSFLVYLGKIEWPVRMKQMMAVCGSDVSRQLGFNHYRHCQPINAAYSLLGEISVKDDYSPALQQFLSVIDALSETRKPSFLPLPMEMAEVVEERKLERKHIPKCVFEDVEICNAKFDECCFREFAPDT